MKDKPKVGRIGELQFTIEEKHAIDFSGDDMPAILSTPWLIWFMEHSARETMLPLLDLEESTVGVVINIEHLAATPVGQCVTCTARVINTEGPLISFSLEARDTQEIICRGTHKLRVVRKSRMARRIQEKLQHMS